MKLFLSKFYVDLVRNATVSLKSDFKMQMAILSPLFKFSNNSFEEDFHPVVVSVVAAQYGKRGEFVVNTDGMPITTIACSKANGNDISDVRSLILKCADNVTAALAGGGRSNVEPVALIGNGENVVFLFSASIYGKDKFRTIDKNAAFRMIGKNISSLLKEAENG